VIGRSGQPPIASRRGCMRRRCAFSLIALMPKRTAVNRQGRPLRRKAKSPASVPESAHPPTWIEPQLTRLAEEAPEGTDWLHEIKYDGYRMHARIDGDKIELLTRTGLDWSHRYSLANTLATRNMMRVAAFHWRKLAEKAAERQAQNRAMCGPSPIPPPPDPRLKR
jgi:hypothetical protein